jgi:hypothetical protein
VRKRWRVSGVVCVMVASLWAGTARGAQEQKRPDAAAILASAREALGGEKRLDAVKNFNATGRTRKVQGNNLLPVEFELWCELPDKYARKDEVPAQESGPTTTGFNGDDLIQVPAPQMPAMPSSGAPAAGRAGAPAPNPAAQVEAMKKGRVAAAKQDFVRLTLGMFTASFSSYPLTFSYVGQAEAPQGKADVIEAKGAANFTVRLFINSQTHLPVMISWSTPAPPARMAMIAPLQTGAAVGPPGGVAPAMGSPVAPKPPEFRIYYADYRDADGLMWPYRLRRATNADTTEETTFDRFRTNVKIDPKRFEVVK